MTNRYRSACCCDDELSSVCFLGYGGVPKTGYFPREGCHGEFTTDAGDGFNRHDNWSFCVHDKDEHMVAVIDRTGYKNYAPLAWGDSNPECACSCLGEGVPGLPPEFDKPGISSSVESRPPIAVWYKHPYLEGKANDVPAEVVDDTYFWNSLSQWSLEGVSPFYTRNTFPCACPDHKYDSASGCRSDFFCDQGYFVWCGWDVNDEQLYWWQDPLGNISYLTQSQMQLIGHPDYKIGGTNAGWRTSEFGYVRGGPGGGGREGNVCPTIEETGTKLGFGNFEGSRRKGMNSDYLYLQDIVTQGTQVGKLFPHYRVIIPTSGNVRIESVYNWGSCTTFPYGLWGLGSTFIGVMHREKWYQQYWNSISSNDVCVNGGTNDCPGIELGIESDIYSGAFAEKCRVPKYVVSQCSGVPLFSHEIVLKLDYDYGIPSSISELKPDYSQFKVNVLNLDGTGVIQKNADSLAAYVMGCIRVGSFMHPQVTEYMERCGILPPPINYGEEQDYRIFKKSLAYHDVSSGGGSSPVGHCCVNLTAIGTPEDFPIPLACDCGVDGAIHCGFTGSLEEAEAAGISSCWVFNGVTGGDIDSDTDGVPDGIECARFICGDIPGESYEDFLQTLIDDDRFTSIQNRIQAVEQTLLCCENDWDVDCVLMAQLSAEYKESRCGPGTLCFDVPEGICRTFLGGQFFTEGNTGCIGTINDDSILTCKERIESDDVIGSLCFVQEQAAGFTPRMHCIETTKQLTRDVFGMDGPDGSPKIYDISNDPNDPNSIAALANIIDNNRGAIQAASKNGDSDTQLDLLINDINVIVDDLPFWIGIALRFTRLGNCEPLCEIGDTIGNTLNTNAKVCDIPIADDDGNVPPPQAGDCDFPETTYPCCNPDIDLDICFTIDDFYFYGRPGEWRPVCGIPNSQLPDEDPGNDDTEPPGSFQAFFPSISNSASARQTDCPGYRCWSAQPFPSKQTSEKVPDASSICPTRENGVCTGYEITPNEGCGLPPLAVCGNGAYNGSVMPGDFGNEGIPPEYPGAYDYGNGTNYDVLNELCTQEGYSYTCFGAWYQACITGFKPEVGTANDCQSKEEDYYCASINNAFFLRMPPGVTHDDSFCVDYQVDYSLHTQDQDGGGGTDNGEWEGGPCNNISRPAVLVYHNRVLDDFIQFYGGCEHKIIQGDSDALVSNLFSIEGVPDGVSGEAILKWDLFEGDPGGVYEAEDGWKRWEGDTSFAVERNDGDPSSSSNPYIITVTLANYPITELPPNVWWGIVRHAPGETENKTALDIFGECGIANRNSLFPATAEQNKVTFKIKTQNPGDVPNGLRDYQWYSGPIKFEGPLPSAFFRNQPECWDGNPCCNTKTTQQVGSSPIVCPHWKADRIQGRPGGESECNFSVLPSNGEGLPDPLCGSCEEGTYCCPYSKTPRCIPNDTFCCTDCEEDQICVVGSGGGLECVPE